MPMLLFDQTGAAAVLSPAENYLTALHSTKRSGLVEVGLRFGRIAASEIDVLIMSVNLV